MSKRENIVTLATQGIKRAEIARRVGCSRPYVTQVLGEGGTPETEDRLRAAKLVLLRARAENEELKATLAEMRLKVLRGELLNRAEVTESFQRVFSPFRQAVQEVSRRYGPEAAKLAADLVNSELAAADRRRVARTREGRPE